jgi:chromosome partitioning protein
MPIISFVSSKGGVGKTTASLLTAIGLAARETDGRPTTVVVVDADPNLPLRRWATLPNRPSNVIVLAAPNESELVSQVQAARFGRYPGGGGRSPDWVVIDTEGGARHTMHTAIRLADLVLTPAGPSTLEAVETLKVIGYVREASRTFKRPIPHACVLTRIPAAIRPRSVKLVWDQLKAQDVPIVGTPLVEKEAFRVLFTEGGTLDTLDPKAVSGIASARLNLELFAADVSRLARHRESAAVAAAS